MLIEKMKGVQRIALSCVMLAASGVAVSAQSYVFELNPQQSQVSFTLGDVLHTVHGTFQVKRGSVTFDTSTGSASGLIVVDATSGESGNKARDHKMHKEILESDRFPEITFAPQHVLGQFLSDGRSQITMNGLIALQSKAHPISITIPVEVHSGSATANLSFPVPYVQWGLKDPSTFILRVNKEVKIDIHAVGRLQTATPTQSGNSK